MIVLRSKTGFKSQHFITINVWIHFQKQTTHAFIHQITRKTINKVAIKT